MPTAADTANTADTSLETNTFDVSLRELEGIVSALERGDIPLEELLEKYARGIRLQQHCQSVLRTAELRIEQLQNANAANPANATFSPIPDSDVRA
jgi:exodeoxyribonuclease VII small subunit